MAEKRVVLLKRANKLFRQGKAEAAVKEYKKILDIKPDDLEVRRIIGDLQLRQNNISDAVTQFEWIADHYLKEGFFAKAIAMFKRITRVDPGYEGALFKLADLYTKQGLVMEAKQIYLDIADECKRQNNQKKALDMYRKILEFDRSNIKMRLLLADNFLKEGLEDNAVSEYNTAADILMNKKDYRRAEELLLNSIKKIKNTKLIEKLIYFYTKQEEDEKAITLLKELGLDVFKNVDLLKQMGELYLKKNMMDEAENIFSKIAEIDPEESEVIMRLGKVYMQRDEYDKTYKLFLPIIEKNLADKKFDEAASLLRFIIASNNTYLPALTKLASIFKESGKTNNLIAMYESLLPIYEQKGLKKELEATLEELIRLSDSPFNYEDQLARLRGTSAVKPDSHPEDSVEDAEVALENEREREFINFNMRVVAEALQISDFNKALETLKKSKSTFPQNIEIRQKLFEVYQQMEQIDLAVEEGKSLLNLYKNNNQSIEHADLLHKLSTLKPEDDKLVALSGDEKTSIEIDFDRDSLEEEISDSHMEEDDLEEGDVLLLSDAESLHDVQLTPEDESGKSLSSVLSEVDFYVNDGYFGDAQKLIDQLKEKYPGNQKLLDKIKRLEEAKQEALKKGDSGSSASLDFEIEDSAGQAAPPPPPQPPKEHTERIGTADEVQNDMIYQGTDSRIEIDLGELDPSAEAPEAAGSSPGLNLADSGLDLGMPESQDSQLELEFGVSDPSAPLDLDSGSDLGSAPDLGLLEIESSIQEPPPPSTPPEAPPEAPPAAAPEEESDVFELDPSMSHDISGAAPPSPPTGEFEDSSMLKISESAYAATDNLPMELEEEELELGDPIQADEDSAFEIESSISAESAGVQEHEDSKISLDIPEDLKTAEPGVPPTHEDEIAPTIAEQEIDYEIEMEEPKDTSAVEVMEIDQDLLVQSPSVEPGSEEKALDGYSSSVIDEIDLDSIIDGGPLEEEPETLDAPFQEMPGAEHGFDSDEDLLAEEATFLDEPYLEPEKNVQGELEAIAHWLKELEKQRTSTIEKNMMEIFEEFKKGVDEKIGKEDYDTRYNLGIAYKEMGLLEEAIHEFLISSKHPAKFFDSAGLLGMCFREKGMFSEAITWFDKALTTPNRRMEEYLAVKYELVMTHKQKEDYTESKRVLTEILKESPQYRNAAQLFQEIKTLAG